MSARTPSPKRPAAARRAPADAEATPHGASPIEPDWRLNRRSFMGLVGLTAGVAGLSGCRRPVEKIYPFAERPEDRVPGQPEHYATAVQAGGDVLGLLVESHDGRPTKIEGNPRHPGSDGASSSWAQAAIYDLYDPDRLHKPSRAGVEQGWADFWAELEPRLDKHSGQAGAGLALVIDQQASPTQLRLLDELKQRLPKLRLFEAAPSDRAAQAAACASLGAQGQRLHHKLDQADVVAAFDCDLLGVEPGAVRATREFSALRSVSGPMDEMNRLYAVEPSLSLTGAMADHRLRARAGEIEKLLRALAQALFGAQRLQPPADSQTVVAALGEVQLDAAKQRFVSALAKDLMAHRSRSLICVGMRQPAQVHALALFLNTALGNLDQTLRLVPDPLGALPKEPLAALAAALQTKKLETLISLGGNPVYAAPQTLGLDAMLPKLPFSAHLSLGADETSTRCTWQLPQSHFLEAWGDLRAGDGSASVVQPLIAPLFESQSAIAVLGRLLGDKAADGHALVRQTWAAKTGDLDRTWPRWLHDGAIPETAATAASPALNFAALRTALAKPVAEPAGGFEVNYYIDYAVHDGCYANNSWLQELPDPITKLVWDNAVLISPRNASELGVEQGDMLRLSLADRSLEAAAYVLPGLADNCAAIAIGYGRSAAGRFGKGVGFDAGALRAATAPWFEHGVQIEKTGQRYQLVTTQEHHWMEGRPLARAGGVETFRANPRFAKEMTPKHPDLKALWEPPNESDGVQWGMSIDLNACTGCNACMIACQAENNILVVGKENTRIGREMHWIRVDRYFEGDENDPEVLWQPVNCQQCELAPCEAVCPVAATSHSPEGLNDQVYNRCVGTRYCANNCPYKVRRFNFFNYAEDLTEQERMGKNPDVTVRLRGVMEKCTYCVQRINRGRIDAKRERGGELADGDVMTACQQVCPAKAISFGNINDPQSEVTRKKKQPRDYGLLEEYNTRPRTSYLAKLRNPNPELVD